MFDLDKKIKSIPLTVWFYDFEVFKKYWCVSFYNLQTKKYYFFDDAYKLKNFYLNALSGCFLVGFNSVRYDDYVLKAILQDIDPYLITDWIINQKKHGWEYPNINNIKLKVYSVDMMDLLSGSRISLKTYEAFLGFNIYETTIPFNTARQLSEKEKQEVYNYNKFDVQATVYLFCKFIDQFLIKLKLIEDYKIDNFKINKTLSALTSIIFQANKNRLVKYESYKLVVNNKIKAIYDKYLPTYKSIIKNFEDVRYYTQLSPKYQKEQIRFSIITKDYDIYCASGGAHGSVNNYLSKEDELIIVADYFSNYSNLIAKYDLGSRACTDMSTTIEKMLKEREVAKANNDTLKAAYLKLALVMPFGSMDYIYNDLWDPKQRQGICVSGQLLIIPIQLILKQKYGDKVEFLQINTDGIIFKLNDKSLLTEIQNWFKEWETITNMKMELSYFKRMFQKDVNNYILVDDINNSKNWKTKGRFVKYYKNQFHNPNFNEVRGTLNNVLTVIDLAVVNYFVKNIPVSKTIRECEDLIKFQYVFQVKGKYEGVMLGDEMLEKFKTWRIFFTKSGKPIFKVYCNENNELKKEKIASTSERNSVFNGDIRKLKPSDVDLDYAYYERLAQDVIWLYENQKETFKPIFYDYPGECFECGLCSVSLLDEKVVRKVMEKEVCKDCYSKN